MRWIVVGAGSGGCVAAGRLAENPANTVVLLEHGPDLDPAGVPPSLGGPDFLATFDEPGRLHEGIVARRGDVAIPYRRGRGVGGSSAVNAMIALRGASRQYAGWGWDDVDDAWRRVRIPEEPPHPEELGPVDRALLASDPDARPAPLTRREGRRVTAAEAYLWPVRGRPNLAVRPDTEVERVVLDGSRAVGIRAVDGTELAADRVVVAAGAIHTPVLLGRSGVVVDGLGEGLMDHPAVSLTIELRGGIDGRGVVAAGALAEHGDVQLLALNRTGTGADARRYGALLVGLMRPAGPPGRVRPDASGSGTDVELGPLTDRRDLGALAAGVERARTLLESASFREIVAAVYVDEHGTPLDRLDDGRVGEWLRSTTGSYLHATSTCAMGRVVDSDGAIVGHESLYVCDASAFPAVPDVNTHLPTVMLAERLVTRWTARDEPAR